MDNIEDQEYKSIKVKFYQDNLDCMLTGDLVSYKDGNSRWEFSIYNYKNSIRILEECTLQQLIELILLGKMEKDKLIQTAEEKVASVVAAFVYDNPNVAIDMSKDPRIIR